jgi:plasmid stability protein
VTKRTSNHVEEERAGFRGPDCFTFEVTDEAAARALREQAAIHGRSVEAELDELVRKAYGPAGESVSDGPDEHWAEELVRITRPGFETDPFEHEPVPFREIDL